MNSGENHIPEKKRPVERLKSVRERQLDDQEYRKPARMGSSSPEAAAATERQASRRAAMEELQLREGLRRTRRDRRLRLIQLSVVLLQIALLVWLLLLLLRVRQTPEPETVEARWLVPGQPDIVQAVTAGDPVTAPEAAELDGYTFLRWEDGDGNTESRETFPLTQDTVYIARYAMLPDTETHFPYLSLTTEGILDVDAPVLIGDAVEVLYRLLNIDLVGDGEFLDVPEKSSLHPAAATLKTLGVLSGARLYPEETLTRAELFRMLSCFYPEPAGTAVFRDLAPEDDFFRLFSLAAERGWIDSGADIDAGPEHVITRGELPGILNRVLERPALHLPSEKQVGMILDVSPSSPYYPDVIEAVIPHEHTVENGEEIWTASEPLPFHGPGYFFVGVRMHCILEDGQPVYDRRVGALYFNANGELSSGDAELDRLLWNFLEETVDPSRMQQDDMLRAVYDRLCSDFSLSDGFVYEPGTTDWVIPEAKRLLSSGHGNSYGFAAAFYELAYLLGYETAVPISGIFSGKQTEFRSEDGSRVKAPDGYIPHAWVEITFKGMKEMFDPHFQLLTDNVETMYMRYFDGDQVRWNNGYKYS